MKSVFVVQHMHVTDGDKEEFKFIGVYSSYVNAEETVKRLSTKPGFCDFPDIVDSANLEEDDDEDGFYIGEYKIDKDHWCSGFD